jgi:hypothetical protein
MAHRILHLGRNVRVGLAISLTACLVLVALSHAAHWPGDARATGTVLMALDTDTVTAGNQDCVSVSVGSSVAVDLVIENAPDVEGFGMRLVYDNAIASIQARDRSVSVLGTGGLDVGDPLPDTSNGYLDGYAGADTTTNGILTRYTIKGEAAGLTRLHLRATSVDTNYSDSSFVTHLPDATQDAFLSVGAACPDASSNRDGDSKLDFGADGIPFTTDDDNCPSAPNDDQADRDGDTLGDACDPVILTIDVDTSQRKTQSCLGNLVAGPSATVTVDLVLRSANPEGYQLRLDYDRNIVTFLSRDKTKSVFGSSGLEFGGPPSSGGSLYHAYTGSAPAPLPFNGVLMRYTVHLVADGMTRLHLTNGLVDSGWVDSGLSFHTADQTPDSFLVVGAPCPDASNDRDADGVTDYNDNCPNIANAGQQNTVHSSTSQGDACDDPDLDGVFDSTDNCPNTSNASQANTVHSGTPAGDACDDPDVDGVFDVSDNCPSTANATQANVVHPGSFAGDACDDPDVDGVFDVTDNCPSTANATQANVVHPGSFAGDACDDPDVDGVFDTTDNCPNNANPTQANVVHPGSSAGDACDDPDIDGVFDATDNCPDTGNAFQADNDGDGQPGVQPGPNDTFGGNACDPDDDNDGIDDGIDSPALSFTFSNDFLDGAGIPSFGSIVSRGALSLRVRDEADPAGVRIKATGSGAAANIAICGLANLTINAGNESVVTCGSATVQVASGPVTLQAGRVLQPSSSGQRALKGTLPAGTTVTVSETGAAVAVCNSGASSTSVAFTGIVIAPGSCSPTDSDGDGFFDATENFIFGNTTSKDVACSPGAWPPNLNDSSDNSVDIFDVGPLKPAFGSTFGQAAYLTRVDLNGDNAVNIADLGLLKRFFGLSC